MKLGYWQRWTKRGPTAKVIREELRPGLPVPVKIIEPGRAEGASFDLEPFYGSRTYENLPSRDLQKLGHGRRVCPSRQC